MASPLFAITAAIASENQAEIDCLTVIKTPQACPPSEFFTPTQEARKILQRLERLGRHQHLLVNTQILLAHNITEAILETIRDRQIKLLILGWPGFQSNANRIFGSILDNLIARAPCDLLLVKPGQSTQGYPLTNSLAGKWLISVAGGPNVERALDLLPSLLSGYAQRESPEILLSKVYSPREETVNYDELKVLTERLKNSLSQPITPVPLCSASISDAIISLAESRHCEVVVLGSSREGLLQNILHGNIPFTVAQQVESTVLIFRSAFSAHQDLAEPVEQGLFADFRLPEKWEN